MNKETHKASMEIGFSESDDHTHDLVSWLIGTVRASSAEYGSEKRFLCESLGYENAKYRMQGTVGPIGGVEDIVDHELGLSDYLPISNVRVVDSRFGIEIPVDLGCDHGRIQIRSNSTVKCSIVMQVDNGDVISFEGLMTRPAIPDLPADKCKLAVDTWCFIAFVSADGRLSVEFKNIWDNQLPIKNVFELTKLFSWNGQEIAIKFAGEDISPLNFTGQFFSAPHEGLFLKMSMIMETLHNIQMRTGHTQARISLADLRYCLRELSFVREILTAENVEFWSEWDSVLRSDLELSQLLGYFSFQVGEFCYFVVFDASVTCELNNEERIGLHCGERVLRDCLIGSDKNCVESAGKRSYELEADRRGDECLAASIHGLPCAWGSVDGARWGVARFGAGV